MPVLHVEMFTGRSAEQKREMVRELTDAFVRTAGGKPESVHVVIKEVDPAHWAVGGEIIAERGS